MMQNSCFKVIFIPLGVKNCSLLPYFDQVFFFFFFDILCLSENQGYDFAKVTIYCDWLISKSKLHCTA